MALLMVAQGLGVVFGLAVAAVISFLGPPTTPSIVFSLLNAMCAGFNLALLISNLLEEKGR